MYKLKIITSTIREGRKGPLVAAWIKGIAEKNPDFSVELLDLAEIALPLMNEPNHPRLKKYEFDYTKAWSQKINDADAFVFVTAEYNHGIPGPLKNAIDYLYLEWGYKAAGIVSYGGVSAGTRGANMLKEVLTAVKIMPVPEAVHIPVFNRYITDDEQFQPEEPFAQSANLMLKELVRWTKALITLRNS